MVGEDGREACCDGGGGLWGHGGGVRRAAWATWIARRLSSAILHLCKVPKISGGALGGGDRLQICAKGGVGRQEDRQGYLGRARNTGSKGFHEIPSPTEMRKMRHGALARHTEPTRMGEAR